MFFFPQTIGNQAHLKKNTQKKLELTAHPHTSPLPPTESRCSLFDLFGCTRGSRIVSQNVIMTEHYDPSQQPRLINVTAFSCKFSFFFLLFCPSCPLKNKHLAVLVALEMPTYNFHIRSPVNWICVVVVVMVGGSVRPSRGGVKGKHNQRSV